MDNIKMWTGFPAEEPMRMTEDRDKWRKCVHGVANAWIEDGQKQNRKSGKVLSQLTLTVSQLSVIVMTTAGHVTCQPIAVPERTWVS